MYTILSSVSYFPKPRPAVSWQAISYISQSLLENSETAVPVALYTAYLDNFGPRRVSKWTQSQHPRSQLTYERPKQPEYSSLKCKNSLQDNHPWDIWLLAISHEITHYGIIPYGITCFGIAYFRLPAIG